MNAIGYLNAFCGVASFTNTNLQTNNEPFDVHLVSKRKCYPKNTLKIPRLLLHVESLHYRFRAAFHGSTTRGCHYYVA